MLLFSLVIMLLYSLLSDSFLLIKINPNLMPEKFSGKSICKLYTFKKSYYVTIISDDGISVTLFQSSMTYKGSRY